MLTAEQNERLTRVGPGTPGGELLRRYWHPVAMVPDLSDESPTKHVRLLSEDLVLFRDKSGQVGLLADHCPHRGASLLYGRVEERGIACAYHGWLYDTQGNCLETPAEPADSLLHLTVKHRAYPVRKQYGLYWAYLGPSPAPVLLRYDFAELGSLSVSITRYDCNWLQCVENNLDQAHVLILHQNTAQRGVASSNSGRGLIDQLAGFEYQEVPLGIKRQQIHHGGEMETDLMVLPGSQRIYNHMSFKVPLDDTHTHFVSITADISLEGSDREGHRPGDVTGYKVEPLSKTPEDAIHPRATYQLRGVKQQDIMVLETQGAIALRENERLGTTDRGVVLLREMVMREIDKVERGLDPIGVVRDPEQGPVDTYVDSHLALMKSGFRRRVPAGRG